MTLLAGFTDRGFGMLYFTLFFTTRDVENDRKIFGVEIKLLPKWRYGDLLLIQREEQLFFTPRRQNNNGVKLLTYIIPTRLAFKLDVIKKITDKAFKVPNYETFTFLEILGIIICVPGVKLCHFS